MALVVVVGLLCVLVPHPFEGPVSLDSVFGAPRHTRLRHLRRPSGGSLSGDSPASPTKGEVICGRATRPRAWRTARTIFG